MYCRNIRCSLPNPCTEHGRGGTDTKFNGVILVTGGAGYIGSHTVLELVRANYKCVIVDNLSNSSQESLHRVGVLSQRPELIEFYQVDLCDRAALEKVFESYEAFDACIHFAGLKAVGESVACPLKYYQNNITGTLVLLEVMEQHRCFNLIFSSSATVYGEPSGDPSVITEDYQLRATNPYGRTKLFIEDILRDVAHAQKAWKICLLRYFNPIGNDSSGVIGESPNGIPNNLFPFVLQVAGGRRKELAVFGNDFPTVDGTGVRDYIHVVDLAKGHMAALKEGIFGDAMASNCEAFNLGTGVGVSVLQMVSAVSAAAGRDLPFNIGPRRPGDVAVTVCNPVKANTLLKWKATKSLQEACADGYKWQTMNPKGYDK